MGKNKTALRLILLLALGSLLFSACAASAATSTQSDVSQTPPPTSTATRSPTATPTKTLIPSRTHTPLPTPTPTLTQTLIPSPTLSPTVTPTASSLALSVNNIRGIQQLALWGKGTLQSTAWSPDGRFFAIGTSLGVYLYDAITLQELRFIRTGEMVYQMAFSPDGSTLATGYQSVRLWDTVTGSNLGTLDGKVQGWISYLEFSPGGSMIAALGIDGTPGDPPSKLFVWEATSRNQLYMKSALSCGHGNSFTFSHDGTSIAYLVCGTVGLIKAATGDVLPIPLKEEETSTTAFSPDGNFLVTDSGVVEIKTGNKIRTLMRSPDPFSELLFTPDGKTLILENYYGGKISFLDFEAGEVRFSISDAGDFDRYSLRPDGLELATIGNHSVKFWNIETGAQTREIDWESKVSAVSFANVAIDEFKGNLMLVAGSLQGQVKLLDPGSGRVVQQYQVSDLPIYDVAVHPDGKRLGVSVVDASNMNKIKINLLIYSLYTGQLERNIPVDNPYSANATWGMAFSQDGEGVAVKNTPYTNSTYGWNIQTGDIIPEPAQKTWFNAVDFGSASNGHLIIIPYHRKIIDAHTGGILSPIIDFEGGWSCSEYENIMVSSDSRYFALGCDIPDLLIWDLIENKKVFSLTGHKPSGGDGFFANITDLAFSPYGYLLVSSGYDNTIRFWDAARGQLLVTISEHSCTVEKIVFSSDGHYLASTSCDGTVRLWGLRK